jgi:hypothetical protein
MKPVQAHNQNQFMLQQEYMLSWSVWVKRLIKLQFDFQNRSLAFKKAI